MKKNISIKDLRKKTKLSQTDMANAISCERSTYGRKENGDIPFYAHEIAILMRKLKPLVSENEYRMAVKEWLDIEPNLEPGETFDMQKTLIHIVEKLAVIEKTVDQVAKDCAQLKKTIPEKVNA